MAEPATHHRLDGLEPDNLLAFLALLGLLRALEVVRAEWWPRAAWDVDRSPLRPVLVISEAHSPSSIAEAAAEGAGLVSEIYSFPAEKPVARAQRDLNYSEGFARRLLEDVAARGNRDAAALWAAVMSDAATHDGQIEATPLCLLFGQGHQHFLDRLAEVPRLPAPPARGRGRNRKALTPGETLEEALFEPWQREDPTPGFRWDPAEDVRYALRASDPSDEKSTTQHGANRLAVLGLPIFTAVPAHRGRRVRLQVIGTVGGRDFLVCWPIWRTPASLAAIRAMLSHPGLTARDPAAELAHLGVVQVRCARRIVVGRYMNFSRAEVVGSNEAPA
jgi:hypothetical protein